MSIQICFLIYLLTSIKSLDGLLGCPWQNDLNCGCGIAVKQGWDGIDICFCDNGDTSGIKGGMN
jgi:hypothetical protein